MQNEAKVRKYKTKLKSTIAEMQSHRLTGKPYLNTGLKDVKSPKDLQLQSVTGEKQVLAAHQITFNQHIVMDNRQSSEGSFNQ